MLKWTKQPISRQTVCALACAAFLLVGCDDNGPNPQLDLDDRIHESEIEFTKNAERPESILFGFDLRSSPQEDARQYLPFMKYLEKETGLHFKLRFTPSSHSLIDDLGNNTVQFAAIGANTFIASNERYGALPLVRGLNQLGKSEYQSMFVVLPGSTIKKLSDIRGKRFAFGSNHSTQGNLIPRIILAENNIKLDELASHKHTGSHQNCANAVLSGKADVCGMQDTMAKSPAKNGSLRILYTSDHYPSSGISANKDVSPAIVAKVKKALLDFKPQGKDKAGLYHWDKTEMPLGFVEAQVEDYDQLKHWSKKIAAIDAAAVIENE